MNLRRRHRAALAASLLGLYVVATTALPLVHNAHHERAHGHAHGRGEVHATGPRTRPTVMHHHGPHAHHGPRAQRQANAQRAVPGTTLVPLHAPDLGHADGRVEHFGAATLTTARVVLPRFAGLAIVATPDSLRPAPKARRYTRAHPRAPPRA